MGVIMHSRNLSMFAAAILIAWSVPGVAAEYRVTPVTAPADGKIIVHDVAWHCASGSCMAARTGSSTDTTVCSALARYLGRLSAFVVADAAFDVAALEKCNRRAR